MALSIKTIGYLYFLWINQIACKVFQFKARIARHNQVNGQGYCDLIITVRLNAEIDDFGCEMIIH